MDHFCYCIIAAHSSFTSNRQDITTVCLKIVIIIEILAQRMKLASLCVYAMHPRRHHFQLLTEATCLNESNFIN